MKNYLRKLNQNLIGRGVDIKRLFNSIRKPNDDWFYQDLVQFKNQRGNDLSFSEIILYPILANRSQEAGILGHYFYQDLYVAQKIFSKNPKNHLDIGSRIDGFVSNVASFRKIDIVDIRDLTIKLENINFFKADFMNLTSELVTKYDSISSLHAIEHFGLGRYGDPIDYFGYLKAFNNIYEILIKGGVFYFSVPIGPQRVEFNAHRVFSVSYLLKLFDNKYTVEEFSYINNTGHFFQNVELKESLIDDNFGCFLGTGIFILKKI